jgi:predicted glycosyltransferase
MARKFKPDMFISFASPYAALAGYMMNKPVITFDDTEADPILHRIFPRFSDFIITSDSYEKDFAYNHLRFNGYKETEYLRDIHRNETSVPQEIDPKKPFILLRFVKHSATHEFGQAGFSPEYKKEIIDRFQSYGQVKISSEEELPSELEPYKINCAPEEMHQLMARASLFFGESATMAAESAVMGVPSVLVEDKGRGYTRDLEKKYGILKNFTSDQKEEALQYAKAMLKKSDNRGPYMEKHHEIIAHSTNVTKFLHWLTDHLPDSLVEMEYNKEVVKEKGSENQNP